MRENSNLYWNDMRAKQTFEQAAEEAKRELYPELFFSDYEPAATVCRVCQGQGFHSEKCQLRHPDGKDKAYVEDILAIAPEKDIEKKSLIEVERERLAALNAPAEKPKVKVEEKPLALPV